MSNINMTRDRFSELVLRKKVLLQDYTNSV